MHCLWNKIWALISEIKLELYLDLFLNTYMLIHIKISIYDTFCAFSTNKQYGILKNASVKFLVRCVLAVALLFH